MQALKIVKMICLLEIIKLARFGPPVNDNITIKQGKSINLIKKAKSKSLVFFLVSKSLENNCWQFSIMTKRERKRKNATAIAYLSLHTQMTNSKMQMLIL